MIAVCNVWLIYFLQHNRKFRPKPKYEPRIHSVKDIKEVNSTDIAKCDLLNYQDKRSKFDNLCIDVFEECSICGLV